METKAQQNIYENFWARPNWFADACSYAMDAYQRSILFTDILRKRGNMYLAHQKAGEPPVLVFDYDMTLDGRTLDKPVNYALVKIVNPFNDTDATTTPKKTTANDLRMRPIVVIDPRAGHGPGIGGSKLDSQIGVALKAGHPVYFVMFFPEPEPGQTISDVQQAEVKFLEEVTKRHPEAHLPAVIGNCQAGWATALIGADRPDVTGPMVFNGSPLSYWGGVEGANPMRYKGGLCGGTWMTSLWCDLGNGKFDGANLVSGFEDLNPANTLWTKQYNVYANVDTEEERFLNFEKWWGGFFKMNRDEIHFIVESLFVGDELEQGKLKLRKDHWVNLKNFKEPIVVFASQGDNITPPQQALNWIYKVYKTVNEIKRNGQVIVYIIHPNIGHLGIFVGSKVAKKEHSAIIGTVDMIDYLPPGLYEMVITDESAANGNNDRKVEFVERTMEDILSLDDGQEDEMAFDSVSELSKLNDNMYLAYISPIVRLLINDSTAEIIRQAHPLRVQRYACSDLNPFFWPYQYMAPLVKANRQPIASDNPFLQIEKEISNNIISTLNSYRDQRDSLMGATFKFMYENPWMQMLFPKNEEDKVVTEKTVDPEQENIEKELWQKTMRMGGFEVAVIRIVLAVSAVDSSIDQREHLTAQHFFLNSKRLSQLKPSQIKQLVKEQSAIVSYDKEEAINTLINLLPAKGDRERAFEAANAIAGADLKIGENEKELLEKIRNVLQL
jgi:tellurite resistance protein